MANTLPVKRDEKGRILPGHSLNPSGKSPRKYSDGKGGYLTKTELFTQDLVEVYDLLLGVIRDDSEKTRDRVAAMKLVIEHGTGTPKHSVELTTDDKTTGTVVNVDLNSDDVATLRKLLNAEQIEIEAEIVEDDDAAE